MGDVQLEKREREEEVEGEGIIICRGISLFCFIFPAPLSGGDGKAGDGHNMTSAYYALTNLFENGVSSIRKVMFFPKKNRGKLDSLAFILKISTALLTSALSCTKFKAKSLNFDLFPQTYIVNLDE